MPSMRMGSDIVIRASRTPGIVGRDLLGKAAAIFRLGR